MDNFAKFMNPPVTVLFQFDFEQYTINFYIHKYCREHGISTMNGKYGGVYADVNHNGVYYRLDAENIGGITFEVTVNEEDFFKSSDFVRCAFA